MIFLNGHLVTPTIFPDKTSQVWHLDAIAIQSLKRDNLAIVFWKFESEAELMHVAQLKLLIKATNPFACVNLHIPYLPYARQDKEVSNESTFALRAFAKQVDAMDFDFVHVIDPHSPIAKEEIGGLVVTYPKDQLVNAKNLTNADEVCYPDNGARNKYTMIYDSRYLYGEKVRDQATGQITRYELHGNAKGKSILIVDDICDGGMTFILLAKELLQAGAKEVNLFVTHGIFSKGTQVLRDAGIKRIFTYKGEVL